MHRITGYLRIAACNVAQLVDKHQQCPNTLQIVREPASGCNEGFLGGAESDVCSAEIRRS